MKNLALILGLIVAASPAFASRARLEALGEGKNGSYYINDSRNIFLNPAQIVKHKKKLWLELGSAEATGTVQDTALAPRAQGGFSNTFGDYTYGVYFNQNSERTINTVASVNATLAGLGIPAANQLLGPDSTVEAFFAGEGGMNWGLSVFFAGNGDINRSYNQLGIRLGIESGNLQVFASGGLMTKSTSTGAPVLGDIELKGKVGIDAGITYGMDNWTWFGKFTTIGSSVTSSSVPAANTDTQLTGFGAGFGYTKEWSKTVTMFTRLEADYQTTSLNSNTSSKIWNVPVSLGAEAQALSWLAVRGSIQQSLLGQEAISRTDLTGNTVVAAGLGATFGDVNIDGLLSIATAGNTNPWLTNPGFGSAPSTGAGRVGFGDNMLGRVAVTYNF